MINIEKICRDIEQNYENIYLSLINKLKVYNPIDFIEYITLQNIMNGKLDGNNTFCKTSTLELIYGIILSIDFEYNKYEIDINEARNMVINNEIEDAKTAIGILLAKELI